VQEEDGRDEVVLARRAGRAKASRKPGKGRGRKR